MHRMREDLREEIVQQADLFNISPDEYVERVLDAFNQNNNYREVLMEDPEEFRKFVDDYHNMTDQLLVVTPELEKWLEETDPESNMQRVLNELITFMAYNPDLLVRLYASFKKKVPLK